MKKVKYDVLSDYQTIKVYIHIINLLVAVQDKSLQCELVWILGTVDTFLENRLNNQAKLQCQSIIQRCHSRSDRVFGIMKGDWSCHARIAIIHRSRLLPIVRFNSPMIKMDSHIFLVKFILNHYLLLAFHVRYRQQGVRNG